MAKIISKATRKQPTVYQLVENGDHFMLGSEVGAYLGFFKGALYKRFPSLWRKVLNSEERDIMGSLSVGTRTLTNMGTMVVRATEAIEILNGDGEIYRRKDTEVAAENNRNKEAINAAFCRVYAPSVDRSVIQQMTYSPAARERNAEKNIERLRQQVHEVISVSAPAVIPSIELDSPAVAVMNSVSLDSVSSPSRRRRKHDDRSKEIQVSQLYSARKIYNDLDITSIHEAADGKEDLIPIRLDIEIDGQKLRDTFTWNKNEKLITPEAFAEALCDDLDLPAVSFAPSIIQALKSQIEQYSVDFEDMDPVIIDQRVLIKLNLHVGNVSLQDQFEWDMSEPLNDPEEFARTLCTELGLGGEFVTAISYSIRGQLNWYRKTYAFHEDPLPTVKKAIRTSVDIDKWCPELETLTEAEMEKKLKDQDRSSRRMRRLANTVPYLQT